MSQLQLNSPPLLRVVFLARQGAPVPEHDGNVAHVVIPRRESVGHSPLAEELGRDVVAVNAFAPLDVVRRRAAPKGRLIAPLFLRPFVIGRIHQRVAWAGVYCSNCRSRLIVRVRRRC